MLLDLLKKSTLQMKSIAINFYFQLELSSVFLCNCIPPGTLYFNSLKFSSFCNREKNTVHLQFEKMRLPLSLSAFQRLCLSFLEKNLKGNCLNGSWFAFMISFQGNVLLFFPPLKILCLLCLCRSRSQLRPTLAAMAEGPFSTILLLPAKWNWSSTSTFSLSFIIQLSSLKKGCSVLTLGWGC